MPPPAEGFAARFVVGPALRTQPDRRLVALVREGYENAFEEIVRRYGRRLTRYAGAIVGNRAEDVTQDAFSKALLALRRDDRDIELRPWLFRIVRNTALNDLRDRPPSAEVLAEAIAGGHEPEEELARREELTELMERLGSLPEAQRAAIVMRELEGLSHEEIARALGLSGGAARQAIFRARQALRDGLGMLLPLPLVKGLLAGTGVAPVETAAGIGGGAAGAGVALKAVTATVLIAGAVGAGVAIDHGRQGPHHGGDASTTKGRQVADDQVPASSVPAGAQSDAASERHDSGGRRRGENEPGDDDGHRRGQNSGSSEPGPTGSGDGSSDSHTSDHRLEAHDAQGSGGGSLGSGSGNGSSGSNSGSSPGGPGGSSDSNSDGSGDDGSSSDSGPGGGSTLPTETTTTDTTSDGGGSSGGGSGSSSGSSSDGSGDSGDSHDGSGLSLQTEPQS